MEDDPNGYDEADHDGWLHGQAEPAARVRWGPMDWDALAATHEECDD